MEGIKRISEMIKGQKDKYLIKVVSYLILQEDMNEAYLKEEKNLKDMSEYIKKQARKEAINGVAVIEDDTVYQWAKEYFKMSNKELGIERKVEKTNTVDKKENNDKFGDIFSSQKTKSNNDIEQISLFAA